MKIKQLLCILLLYICCSAVLTMAFADSGSLSIIFNEDISYPATVPYDKVERIRLDESTVKQAIEKYRLPPRAGEKWNLEVNKCSNPDCVLQFKERNGAAGTLSYDFAGISAHGEGEKYSRASDTVKAFLDEIGLVNYEYPFYFCHDAYLAHNTSPWHPITVEDYLSENGTYQRKLWERTGGSPVLVVVRFQIGEIPFGTSISWTQFTDRSGNGNPTPSAFFLISENGEICAAHIRNPVKVIKRRESGEKILPWKTVFEMSRSKIENVFCGGDNRSDNLTLQHVELVMLTDDKSITFPAWNFVFEWYSPENDRYLVLGLMYNAFTGEQVW